MDHKSSGIEFWIAPTGARIPYEPNCALCICPTLSVDGRESVLNEKTLTFTANVSGGSGETVIYNWKVSAGEIVEGQGTPVVKVDAKGAQEITATVEIGGVCEECMRTDSFTSKINGKLEMIDAFGLESDCQYRGRMDGFLTRLNENPAAKGYVINYGSRCGGAKSLAARNDLIKERLTFRNFDLNRVEFINGGYLDKPATELWISTDDTQKPVPTLINEEKMPVSTAAKKSTRRKSK